MHWLHWLLQRIAQTGSVWMPLMFRSVQAFSITINDASQRRLLASAPDVCSRALVQSTTLPHSGDWLNVVPSPTLGLHLQDKELWLCLKYWLGLPLYNDHSICPECLRPANSFGDHQVGCGGNGPRLPPRHPLRCGPICFSGSKEGGPCPNPGVWQSVG